jgi:hypothetical protein
MVRTNPSATLLNDEPHLLGFGRSRVSCHPTAADTLQELQQVPLPCGSTADRAAPARICLRGGRVSRVPCRQIRVEIGLNNDDLDKGDETERSETVREVITSPGIASLVRHRS